MKLVTTFAVVATALTIGATGAAAGPDGYQPQLREDGQSDAIDRYLRNNAPPAPPDAIERYLKNRAAAPAGAGGAPSHPDSRAVRPGPGAQAEPTAKDGFELSWQSGAVAALGACLIAVLVILGATATRDRRRLALR